MQGENTPAKEMTPEEIKLESEYLIKMVYRFLESDDKTKEIVENFLNDLEEPNKLTAGEIYFIQQLFLGFYGDSKDVKKVDGENVIVISKEDLKRFFDYLHRNVDTSCFQKEVTVKDILDYLEEQVKNRTRFQMLEDFLKCLSNEDMQLEYDYMLESFVDAALEKSRTDREQRGDSGESMDETKTVEMLKEKSLAEGKKIVGYFLTCGKDEDVTYAPPPAKIGDLLKFVVDASIETENFLKGESSA